MRGWVAVLAVVALALCAQVAVARQPNRAERERYRGPGARVIPRTSRSVGLPHRGRLRNGVQLLESRYLRYVTEYAPGGNFHGTWELVQLIERAAYRVWRREPGAKLSVGELSRASGRDIAGHSSHENGRDVDISFYMLDARDRPYENFAYARFNGDGSGKPPNEGLRFDDGRNWELVAKLVADGDARVQYIFVARSLERRLLAEGRRRGARQVILDRAAQVMMQPDGHPHDNHFHVRIYCGPADRPACEDRPPYHSWYPGRPPGARAIAPFRGWF